MRDAYLLPGFQTVKNRAVTKRFPWRMYRPVVVVECPPHLAVYNRKIIKVANSYHVSVRGWSSWKDP